MKILLIGNTDDWMGIHLRQMAAGFEENGCIVRLADYNSMTRFWELSFGDKKREFELRQRGLERLIREFEPELILVNMARHRFDFARIRSYSKAKIGIFDYDGPNWDCIETTGWLRDIDRIFTVSRYAERKMREIAAPVVYMPHGVDCNYYAPGPAVPAFTAPVSYVGRATRRRAEFCKTIEDKGLALYGKRWHRLPECAGTPLGKCVLSRKDIIGSEMVDIYRSSTVMINMLQENLAEQKTIMSLQVFAIPATGACLITERVEELADAFTEGEELLAFDTAEEMASQVERLLGDKTLAAKLGEAGRRRCLECHTHSRRAREVLEAL